MSTEHDPYPNMTLKQVQDKLTADLAAQDAFVASLKIGHYIGAEPNWQTAYGLQDGIDMGAERDQIRYNIVADNNSIHYKEAHGSK